MGDLLEVFLIFAMIAFPVMLVSVAVEIGTSGIRKELREIKALLEKSNAP